MALRVDVKKAQQTPCLLGVSAAPFLNGGMISVFTSLDLDAAGGFRQASHLTGALARS